MAKAEHALYGPRSPRSGWRQRLRDLSAAVTQPQVSSAARERRDTLVLLAALALVVAPHIEHLPRWATAILALLWYWRLWLSLAQRPLPGRFAMLPLLFAVAGAVWLEHRSLLGRDAGVTFLLMLLALKLLEMRAKRDIFVVVFLAFFILLTQFLYGQGPVIGLLALTATVLLFSVLVSVNMAELDLSTRRKVALVLIMLVKAIPLAAALFLLFPRISGPLWGVPGDGSTGRTGLSNTMTPGSIGRLLESEDIVFRVQFAGQAPLADQLYWRGPVLGTFGGRSWAPLQTRTQTIPLQVRYDERAPLEYSVTLEPHQRDWLFVLEMPVALPRLDVLSARFMSDGQVLASGLINERTRYNAASAPAFQIGLNESPLSLRDWLQLPPGFNPRTLAFAQDLRRTMGGVPLAGPQAVQQDDAKLVNAVLQRFRKENYRYTLAPRPLGRHSVDEFLFDTREGFCEHYSSAFVVLMRALDIPARVVTGYQGGEFNPVDGFMTVRQSEAHAWAEVWLQGRGWVRVDPTAAVAPERIDRGTSAARGAERSTPFGVGERAVGLLKALRYNWEAIENSWNQWVLSYSPERQRQFLSSLGLTPDSRTLTLALALVTGTLLAILAAISLRHRVQRDPLGEIVTALRRRLEDAGVHAPAQHGPRALRAHLAPLLAADSRREAERLLQVIEELRYSRAAERVDRATFRALRRAVRRFRPQPA